MAHASLQRWPFPLARIPEFDERSRQFAFTLPSSVGATPPRPKVVAHRVYGKRLDQGGTGSCTGNALTGACNCHPNHKPGAIAYGEPDARRVYALATRLDDVPGEWNEDGTGQDTGSSGLAACKAGVQLGMITRYEWCFGVDHMLDALPSHPVIVGTEWDENMFTPDAHGQVHLGGAVAGGHEWVVRGYHLAHRLFFGLNSWGRTFGINGEFIISFDDMAVLLRRQGDVKVPIAA